MDEVHLVTRHDSEFYARLPQSDKINLCDKNSNIDQAKVCRVCINGGSKLWAYDSSEQLEHLNSGGSLEDLICHPTKSWGSFKVLNQTDYRNRIVPMDTESSVPTRAVVDTCGQQVRSECTKCDNFEPVNVRVAYASSSGAQVRFHTVEKNGKYVTVPYTTDGSAVRNWNVVVGGHCTIPAEGKVVNGSVTFCDWQPRKKRVESPSCANCYYSHYTGDFVQFHHLEVNENAALTPWEREQVPPDEVNLELWRKQTSPFGRRYWFPARILNKEFRNDRFVYHVRFAKSNAEAKIAQDDERFIIHEIGDDKAAVDILYPWNKMFRLHMPIKKNPRVWPKMPENILVEDNCMLYVNSNCRECRPNKACYFHAKGPSKSPVTGEINFYHPAGKTRFYERPKHGLMRVVKRHDRIVAIDGNGNLPEAYSEEVANASVFRGWLPSLLEDAKLRFGEKGYFGVLSQYFDVVGNLVKSPHAIQTRPSWLRTSSREPNKSHCSHPEGANLRKVFQDSFGSERVDWEFDHGAMTHDAVEQEIRVGYRQHSQTPQKLQEEIMATDASNPNYDPSSGAVVPQIVPSVTPVTIRTIAAVGDMYKEDGTPIASTQEFYDALDTEVTVGMSGEVERRISKRQQLFGYDMTRGYYGKRRGSEKTAMPASDPTFVVFDLEDQDVDQIDISDAWQCVECNAKYDQSEIVNFFDPKCEVCDSELYKNHMTRTTYNPRQGGGIGNAIAMDSSYMQTQQRMFSTLCPNWRLNSGTTIITLDDVYGPQSSTPASVQKANIDDPVKVITVGTLSDYHLGINKEYNIVLGEVLEQREVHIEQYPDTPRDELMRLYPTPIGTIYQKKAEGSLSKMGGV